LQAGAPATDQRQHREQPGEVGERAEQGVARTKHGARADDGNARKRLLDQQLTASTRADVWRSGLGVSADAGDEHEARDTGSDHLLRERLGALLVHGLKSHSALLDIGGDRVDDGVSPGNGGGDRGLVAHVGVQARDPIQASRAQDAPRALGMPDSDPYSRPFGGEAPHQPPAEEPGAAEHTDRGHGIPSGMLDKVEVPHATNDSACRTRSSLQCVATTWTRVRLISIKEHTAC
jgi:hypothetical protein